VSNTSTIVPGEVVFKLLCSEVDEEVLVVLEGNDVMSSASARDFLLLCVENSRSYS
jgi:hypothetical protein